MTQAESAARMIEDEGIAAFIDGCDLRAHAYVVANHAETGGRKTELPIEFSDGSRLMITIASFATYTQAQMEGTVVDETGLHKVKVGESGFQSTSHGMVPGQRYRIRYLQQSGNYRWGEWEVVADFVGADTPGNYAVSLRPLAGTQQITTKHVLSVDPVVRENPVSLPRRIGPHAAP